MGVVKTFARNALVTTAKVFGLEDLFLTGQDHIAFTGSAGRDVSIGVDNAYSSSWIAYACIAKQAKDIAGVPLLVLRKEDDPESFVSDTDRLTRLLYNPGPGLTHNQLIQFMVTMLRLRGAFFLDFDQPVAPKRLIPWRDPLNWKPIVDDVLEQVVAWEYRKGSKTFKRLPSEVVVGRQINPTDPWGWQSPLAAAADPLKIDRDGDKLNARTISQGGQNGPTYRYPNDLGDQKYDQLLTRLRNRQAGPGEPLRPLILTNGLDVVDPKFSTTDLKILDQQERSAEKICAIYGMTPALLFKDDSPNRATFETRRRIYWSETLIPIMSHIEDALDQWTVPAYGLYCRFDLTAVQAVREDLLDQVKVAKVLHSMQIPVAAINERLELGLDLSLIPGADSSLVASSLVPVSAVLNPPAKTAPVASEPQKSMKTTAPGHPWRPTNALIRARHKDAVALIARGKARTALETRLTKAWRSEMVKWRAKVAKLADAADGNPGAFRGSVMGLAAEMGKDLVAAAAPSHREAAVEGALSILDLLSEERFYGTENADIFRKTPDLPPEAVAAIKARQNYITGIKAPSIFDAIFDAVEAAATMEDGPTAVDIGGIVRSQFNTEVNRAALIGRQEVGTAFNASRFGTMKSQDINQHEWLTAGDELVRGSDPKDAFSHIDSNGKVRNVGDAFPCDLTYPQENGGEPGNVINCRCLTLPVVEV